MFGIMKKREPKRLSGHTFLFQALVHAFTSTMQLHLVYGFAAILCIRDNYVNIMSAGFVCHSLMAVW